MIIVNGKEVAFEDDLTVEALLKKVGYVFPMVVVKINGHLVDRKAFGRTAVADGDRVDVVHLISGG